MFIGGFFRLAVSTNVSSKKIASKGIAPAPQHGLFQRLLALLCHAPAVASTAHALRLRRPEQH